MFPRISRLFLEPCFSVWKKFLNLPIFYACFRSPWRCECEVSVMLSLASLCKLNLLSRFRFRFHWFHSCFCNFLWDIQRRKSKAVCFLLKSRIREMVFIVQVMSGESCFYLGLKRSKFSTRKIVWFRENFRINFVAKNGLRYNLVSVFSTVSLVNWLYV